MQLKQRLEKQSPLQVTFSLVVVIILFKLASRRSVEPWIFGRYSLPYFVFLVLSAGAVLYVGFLLYRFGPKAIYIILANIIVLVAGVTVIELVGQTYAFFHPSYYVLFVEPDRTVGWKQVPNLRWTWAGHGWYARDFSVPIETNSYGFRDLEREFSKPPGVTRVVLLGDSFVEAVQVSFDKTAGHLLEKKLNAMPEAISGKTNNKYEVLNFGISNYSLGQYLLTWEQYASNFDPDYVFVFVGKFHMNRTVRKYISSAFSSTQQQQLWVRPTFRLEEGVLFRETAQDFDEFVKVQQDLIRTEFDGRRIFRRKPELFIIDYLNLVYNYLTGIQRQFYSREKPERVDTYVDEQILLVNLKIIEEIGQDVTKMGARLVVVDVSRYFDPSATELSTILGRFCAEKQLGYIPLSDHLLAANKNGISTRWDHDSHFNEAGNEIFAEAMYRWMARESGR